MDKIEVTVIGRDVIPMARLLEGLTVANLLSSNCVWEETGDSVTLLIESVEGIDIVGVFQSLRFRVKVI